MTTLWQDLRYGARTLRKNPSFTLVAVLTLALGIGATTAIFSVVEAVLLRPLPYEDSGRLVWPTEFRPKWNFTIVNSPEYLFWRDQNQVFEDIAGYDDTAFTLNSQRQTERTPGAWVTVNIFDVLRTQPVLGRSFRAEEGNPGASRVALMSYSLWQSRFGADRNILGKILKLDGKDYSIIGVLPAEFRFPGGFEPNLFVPVTLPSKAELAHLDQVEVLKIIARLRPGMTLEKAKSDLTTITRRLESEFPNLYDADAPIQVRIISLQEKLVGDIRPALLLSLGTAAMVLLIASVNVANLFLSKAAARGQEIALRTALGASKVKLLNMLLYESGLIAFLGGVFGLAFAYWSIRGILFLMPGTIPRADSIGIDSWVLLFTLMISLLTGIVFAAAPVEWASKLNLFELLKDGNRSVDLSRHRVRGLLVVCEIALSLALLVSSSLLIKSFIRLNRVDLGFNPQNVLAMSVVLPQWKYLTAEQMKAFHETAIERFEALAKVRSAATGAVPLVNGGYVRHFSIEGMSSTGENIAARAIVVSPNYFNVLEIPLRIGRAFTSRDRSTAPRVAIVNERLARTFWPNQDPIGKQIDAGFRESPGWCTIVGVVGDVKQLALQDDPPLTIYLPYLQAPSPEFLFIMTFVARTTDNPTRMASTLRESVRTLDSDAPVYNVATMEQDLSAAIAEPRFNVLLVSLFGILALSLAAVGIYGIVSYWVTARTREIGIRMALGASRGDIMRVVVGSGALLTLTGATLGLAVAATTSHILSRFLYAVSPTDPAVFAGVTLFLAIVALFASYIPARRALRVDPVIALRCD
jgi:putative ABC transport system permease protein